MDIIHNTESHFDFNKPQLENVEKEKHEEKLIGTYILSRGLKLFSFDPITNKVNEVEVKNKPTLELFVVNGRFEKKDNTYKKANVNGHLIYFEALNIKTALKKVAKYKKGMIRELFNLKIPNYEMLKLY